MGKWIKKEPSIFGGRSLERLRVKNQTLEGQICDLPLLTCWLCSVGSPKKSLGFPVQKWAVKPLINSFTHQKEKKKLLVILLMVQKSQSQQPGMVLQPCKCIYIYNGINNQPQLVIPGFQPSTVSPKIKSSPQPPVPSQSSRGEVFQLLHPDWPCLRKASKRCLKIGSKHQTSMMLQLLWV